ncbi:cytochrome c-type biogenesis protein CcmH [Hyphomicrobiales bacterium]|nr:cytochrome c-type biogenesis protein CcmH [Hyphomicrobiales bacterium]MDC0139998.1 cytochrome c-type biogenesis protein CcmH [Hyphomicrobiales bacterium]MDC3272904.1 cytochrome c-type biogenesis protein CcmH [Hyphomicrobiales bacterium]|tara:strand:+ start:93 stop:551 length:459 start_codon:yes stop_codon:yes gene_type:complete
MMVNFRFLYLMLIDRSSLCKYIKIFFLILFYFLFFEADSLKASYLDTEDTNIELMEREREISGLLRCLVCQNQSILESNAPLAKDMRLLVRSQLIDGKSNDEIIDYVHDRYGDFVLMKPLFKKYTIFLWLSPFVFFVMGLLFILTKNKKSKT